MSSICSDDAEVVFYLCNAVVLQVDDPGHGHLHAAEHCNHLQHLIIKWWSTKILMETRAEKRKKEVNFQLVSLIQVMLQLSAGFRSKQSHVLELQLHSVLLLSQNSHYPPWCLPRSWYRLHSWGCWAQPSPADSAETWEHHHTEESQRREEVREEGKYADDSIFTPKVVLFLVWISPPAELAAPGFCTSSGPAL